MALPLLWFQLSLGGLTVSSSGSGCPNAAVLQDRLVSLLPPLRGSHRATLTSEGGQLKIRLYGTTSELLGERSLPADWPCQRLTEAAALTLATWEAELPQTSVLESVAGPVSPPDLAGGLDRRVDLGLSVGLLESEAWGLSGGTVPAFLLDGSLQPADSRWSGHLTFLVEIDRHFPFGPGSGSWRRQWLGAGPSLRLLQKPWSLELGADALLGLLTARGTGLSSDNTNLNIDPGVDATVRFSWLVGRIEPWVGLRTIFWLRPEEAVAEGEPTVQHLPFFELLAGLGIEVHFD